MAMDAARASMAPSFYPYLPACEPACLPPSFLPSSPSLPPSFTPATHPRIHPPTMYPCILGSSSGSTQLTKGSACAGPTQKTYGS